MNILSYTCYRWALTDVANMSIGIGTVGIYQSNLPKDCEYIINHSDAVLIFAENQTQLDKLLEIRSEIPNIKKVILLADIAKFFHAAGLLILEGIGMTENTSFSKINRPDNYNFGVVGPPGAGISHKAAADGEVLYLGRKELWQPRFLKLSKKLLLSLNSPLEII